MTALCYCVTDWDLFQPSTSPLVRNVNRRNARRRPPQPAAAGLIALQSDRSVQWMGSSKLGYLKLGSLSVGPFHSFVNLTQLPFEWNALWAQRRRRDLHIVPILTLRPGMGLRAGE